MKDMKLEITHGVGKHLVHYPSIPVSTGDTVFPIPGRLDSKAFKICHFLLNFLGNIKVREYTVII
jgi:hypothetical protein